MSACIFGSCFWKIVSHGVTLRFGQDKHQAGFQHSLLRVTWLVVKCLKEPMTGRESIDYITSYEANHSLIWNTTAQWIHAGRTLRMCQMFCFLLAGGDKIPQGKCHIISKTLWADVKAAWGARLHWRGTCTMLIHLEHRDMTRAFCGCSDSYHYLHLFLTVCLRSAFFLHIFYRLSV